MSSTSAPSAAAPGSKPAAAVPSSSAAASAKAGAAKDVSAASAFPLLAAAAGAAPVLAASSSAAAVPAAALVEWDDMKPSDQVLALEAGELVETIVRSWVKDGSYVKHVDAWGRADLAPVIAHLKMIPAKSVPLMREQVKRLFRKWGKEHPEFMSDDNEPDDEAAEADEPPAAAEAHRRSSRSRSPARAAANAPVADSRVLNPPIARVSIPVAGGVSAATLAALQALPKVSLAASPRRAPRQLIAAAAPVARALEFDPDYSDEEDDEALGLDGDGMAELGAPSARARRADTAVNMEALGLAAPFAEAFLSNVLRQGPTVLHVMKNEVEWSRVRNQREGLHIAAVIDALRKGDARQALELSTRRLAGVQTSDKTGSWDICDALELHTASQSFVPSAFMQMSLKQVVRMQAVQKAAQAGAAARPNKSSASAGGQRTTHASYAKKNDGAGGAMQSATVSKAAGSGKK